MRVGRLEHLTLPRHEPRGLRGAMAFGAALVPARVVRLNLMTTMVVLGDMSTKSGGPAHSAGPQGPVLLARQGVAIAGQKAVPCWRTTSATSSCGELMAGSPTLLARRGRPGGSRGMQRGVDDVEVEARAP